MLTKKQEGKPIDWPERPKPTNFMNLMGALLIRPGITVRPAKSMTWVLGPGRQFDNQFEFRWLLDGQVASSGELHAEINEAFEVDGPAIVDVVVVWPTRCPTFRISTSIRLATTPWQRSRKRCSQ
jgi:hypothetical protein